MENLENDLHEVAIDLNAVELLISSELKPLFGKH